MKGVKLLPTFKEVPHQRFGIFFRYFLNRLSTVGLYAVFEVSDGIEDKSKPNLIKLLSAFWYLQLV